ncbi:MAG: DUF3341 domain-containing protein [Bacteroidia bacterium]|nr:DUF3341 domain-containing protein [Bacteroidia bacterium]
MSKTIYAVYDDESQLFTVIPSLRNSGLRVTNLQSPFPVHGIDAVLGIPRTRMGIVSFLLGGTGFSLGLLMIWYMMIKDWPMNIGGKPSFALYLNLPAFIPVLFECTVLGAAHGMFIVFLLRSKILPGVTAPIPHLRVTDDKFVLHVEVKEESKINDAINIIRASGASEVI